MVTNLSVLSNEELIESYENFLKNEEIEYKMDGSGELDHVIAKSMAPIHEAYEKEFTKRF